MVDLKQTRCKRNPKNYHVIFILQLNHVDYLDAYIEVPQYNIIRGHPLIT